MKTYKLETWHFDKESSYANKKWTESRYYYKMADLEKDLMLYKLGDFIGYKIFDDDQQIKQEFDKQLYLDKMKKYPNSKILNKLQKFATENITYGDVSADDLLEAIKNKKAQK